MDFIILDNQLNADDFIRLFAAVGWGDVPRDMVETALRNSYATFSLVHESHVVGMARLLGDGAMAFFLKDLAVDPAYWGKGAGKLLLTHVEEYIRSQLQPGWAGYLQLVSAKGKEAFYCKAGYALHPHEHSGAGMSKWITKE